MRVESMKLPGVLGAVLTRLSPKGGLHMRRFIAALFSLAALLATLELRADSACPAGRYHPDLHQSPGNSLRADPGHEFLRDLSVEAAQDALHRLDSLAKRQQRFAIVRKGGSIKGLACSVAFGHTLRFSSLH